MKRIAVATDYSKNAQNAVEFACALAQDLEASLQIVHTYDIWVPVSEVPVALPPAAEIEAENQKKLTEMVAELKKRYAIELSFKIFAGSLVSQLEEFAKQNRIDLLVMGMRGGGEISKLLFGSNTISVIENNFCPVLVVPEEYKYQTPKKFAFAADLQKTQEEKFDLLKYLVKKFKGELQIFNVVDHKTLPQVKEAIEGIKLDAVFDDVKHDYFFPEADEITEGIDHFVYHKKPDWLVMIPREHSFFFRMFREGTTEKVIYNSKIPVLALA